MRYLAIARYREMTTIRQGTPIFVVAILPPLLAAVVITLLFPRYRGGPDSLLAFHAQIALLAWYIHAGLLFVAAEALGNLTAPRVDPTNAPSDLMDSAPLPPKARFAGEMLGIFVATLIIHACCLPMLAVVAALSPLPGRVFLWVEVVILAVMILGSAGAACKRIARPTKMSATRNLRSLILFLIVLFAMVLALTRREQFRDAMLGFFGMPSLRAWERVVAAIDNPVALLVSIAVLYAVYFVFYFVSSTRDPFRA